MRTNQGGSVVSFLVVGVIFVAIVAGAVYALQHRSGGATTTTRSPSVATTDKAPAASSQVPAPSRAAAPSATPSVTPQTNSGQQSANNQAPSNGSPATMPATGPSDMLPSGVIIAVLIGATVAFAQSVKARRQLSV